MQVLFLVAVLIVAIIAAVSLLTKDKSGKVIPETKTTIDPEPTVVIESLDVEKEPIAAPVAPAVEPTPAPAPKPIVKVNKTTEKAPAKKPATKATQAAPATKNKTNKK